jgi:hypothetical protein
MMLVIWYHDFGAPAWAWRLLFPKNDTMPHVTKYENQSLKACLERLFSKMSYFDTIKNAYSKLCNF